MSMTQQHQASQQRQATRLRVGVAAPARTHSRVLRRPRRGRVVRQRVGGAQTASPELQAPADTDKLLVLTTAGGTARAAVPADPLMYFVVSCDLKNTNRVNCAVFNRR